MSVMELHLGDCLEVVATMPADSVDSCITDPPYGLSFMGKDWDYGVPGVAYWREVLRVLKPGGFLLAFGGTRTSHRLTCAIEDAGFEIRDAIAWIYGQGFPKSHDISKGIDKAAGVEREVAGIRYAGRANGGAAFDDDAYKWPGVVPVTAPATDLARQWDGYGTALKPAVEPIVVAMKPIASTFANNAQQWGVAGLWIDGGRIPSKENLNGGGYSPGTSKGMWSSESGGGGIARLPGQYEQPIGRWPANLILDEDTAVMLDEQSGDRPSGSGNKSPRNHYNGTFKGIGASPNPSVGGDSGGASRYFLVCKGDNDSSTWYNSGNLHTGESLCGLEKIRVDDTYVGRKTENSDGYLSIDGYGSKPMGLFHPDTISIIKTETCSTMTFPILSALTGSLIGTCTIEYERHTEQLAAWNIASVSIAENGEHWITTRQGERVLIRGIARIVSVNPSRNGENPTGSVITPTCGNTASEKIAGSRFFYVAKASKGERGEGNDHPTVKPLMLMRYLCRLTRPPSGGIVLDPFMGSGTTGIAAVMEGRGFVGIEKHPPYFEIAGQRIEKAQQRPLQGVLAL